jgi:amidase
MPITPPAAADLAAIAERYGFRLTPEDLESIRGLVPGLLTSYDAVWRLYSERLPDAPDRSWQRPSAADNELGAWYVTTSITDAGKERSSDAALAYAPAGRAPADVVPADAPPAGRGSADVAPARRPLASRSVAVKDNIAVAGVPMMNGSAAVEGYVPRRDATVVTRLLRAGATIAGKAVCEDLCFSGGSHTSRTGPVRNPWDRTRSAGGSSSGSAALVAAGLVDLALGGDQGGSVRIPSSFCGIVGHKPTYGLVPYTGAFPIENTLDHLGPMTRTVRDAAVLLGVLAGPDGLDPRQRAVQYAPPQAPMPPSPSASATAMVSASVSVPALASASVPALASVAAPAPALDFLADLDAGVAGLRIGVVEEGFGYAGLSQPEVDETVRAAIGVLEHAGASVRTVSVPWHRDGLHVWNVIGTDGVVTQMIDGNGYGMNTAGLYDPELIAHYARGRRERADDLPETVKIAAFCGRYMIDRSDGTYYAMARNLAIELTAAYDAALADVDVLIMPTLPIVASVLPAPGASREESVARSTEMIVNTAPLDVSGHPATSVPAGLAHVPGGPPDGLPAGMMIVGRHFADAMCLRVAQAYETAIGGFPVPPRRGS